MDGKKKYINIFGSFTEPFNCISQWVLTGE